MGNVNLRTCKVTMLIHSKVSAINMAIVAALSWHCHIVYENNISIVGEIAFAMSLTMLCHCLLGARFSFVYFLVGHCGCIPFVKLMTHIPGPLPVPRQSN